MQGRPSTVQYLFGAIWRALSNPVGTPTSRKLAADAGKTTSDEDDQERLDRREPACSSDLLFEHFVDLFEQLSTSRQHHT